MMSDTAPTYITEHMLQRGRRKDDGIEQAEYESTCPEKQNIIPHPERTSGILPRTQVVIERVQAQVMRKVLGGQHEPKARSTSRVKLLRSLHVRRSMVVAPKIEVICQPGEKDQECVLFRYSIYHHGDRSCRPQQCAEQPYLDTK